MAGMCRLALAGATAIVLGLAAPAGAVQVGTGVADTGPSRDQTAWAVYLQAASGEANDVTVRASGPSTSGRLAAATVTVTDRGAMFDGAAPFDGALPCARVDGHTMRCTAPAGTEFVQAVTRLGDGDNRLRFAAGSVPLRERFITGDGRDDIATGPFVGDASYRWSSDTGGGDDRVVIGASVAPAAGVPAGLAVATGAGDDTVVALNGAEDLVNCGDGEDTLLADPFDRESIYVEPEGSCETRPGPRAEAPRIL